MSYWFRRGLIAKGGPGSGNFGHAGRPGVLGGSAPDGGGSDPRAPKERFGDESTHVNVKGPRYLDPKDPRASTKVKDDPRWEGGGGSHVMEVGDGMGSRATVQALKDTYSEGDVFAPGRNDKMTYLSPEPLSVAGWTRAMRVATPDGYNDFKAAKVGKVLAEYAGKITVTAGREYSPVAYVHGPVEVLREIAGKADKMKASEATVHESSVRHGGKYNPKLDEITGGVGLKGPVLRLWWD